MTTNNSAQNLQQEKSTGIAVLLSFLWTGAGQLYAGYTERGIILIVIYFLLATLSFSLIGPFILLIPFWIWGMIDANTQANKYNHNLKKVAIEQSRAQALDEEKMNKTISASVFVAQLEKISRLHGANLLNDQEYETRKRDLILTLIEKRPIEEPEEFLTSLIPSIERKYLTESEIIQIKKLVL